MRTRRLLAALGAPLFVVACATATAPAISGSGKDGGSGTAGDASTYGADDTGTGSEGGGGTDGGVTHIDSGGSGGTDSGGGGGVTAGGDCIGDPGASSGFGYDFECNFDEAFSDDEPCTPGMNGCASGKCCYTDTSSTCYAAYGTQCVTTQ